MVGWVYILFKLWNLVAKNNCLVKPTCFPCKIQGSVTALQQCYTISSFIYDIHELKMSFVPAAKIDNGDILSSMSSGNSKHDTVTWYLDPQTFVEWRSGTTKQRTC